MSAFDNGFYKISQFLYENPYVKHVDFACREKYDPLTAKMKGIAHYRFNVMEKIGNALITPLAKTGEHAKRSSSPKAWIALGVIAGIPASLGALLKRIGEALNRKNALRKQAIQQIEQMQEKHFFLLFDEAGEGFGHINQSMKLNDKIGEFVNQDTTKKLDVKNLVENYKNALRSNKNIDLCEKEIDQFFILNPELGEEIKKFAKDFITFVNKSENPFSETPEMKKYKAILAEMDKK